MVISSRLLLLCLNHVCKPVTALFNLCIHDDFFLEKLRTAKITPVYKKAAADLISNYRSISVLLYLNNIVEST